jgi:hypothetical protein
MGADGFFMDAIDASVSKESNGEGGMVAFEAPLTPKTNRRAGSGSSRHGARHGRASVPGRGRLLLGVAGLLGAMLGSRWAHRRRVAAGSWHGEGGGLRLSRSWHRAWRLCGEGIKGSEGEERE